MCSCVCDQAFPEFILGDAMDKGGLGVKEISYLASLMAEVGATLHRMRRTVQSATYPNPPLPTHLPSSEFFISLPDFVYVSMHQKRGRAYLRKGRR